MSPAAEKTAVSKQKMGGKEFEEAFKPKNSNIVYGKLANEKETKKKKKKKTGFGKILIILILIVVLIGGAGAALYFSGNLTAVFDAVGLKLPSKGPSIAEQQAELDRRKAELDTYEQSLNELKAELDDRQAALEEAQMPEVQDTTFEGIRAGFSEEKLTELQQIGTIYSKMDATSAAAIMTQLYDSQQIAVIVFYMQPAASAAVLEKLDPELAADVTRIMAS